MCMYFSLILHATFSYRYYSQVFCTCLTIITKDSVLLAAYSTNVFVAFLTHLLFLFLLFTRKNYKHTKEQRFFCVFLCFRISPSTFFFAKARRAKKWVYHEESITVLLCQKSFIQRGQTLQVFVCVFCFVLLEPLNLF